MTTRQVLYTMLNMAKEDNITFVMVTHENDLAACADRIVTIKDGQVLSDVLLSEEEKQRNREKLFGGLAGGDVAEPETTLKEEKEA